MSLVVDNSVFLSWCVPEEQTVESLSFLGSIKNAHLHVPAVWPIEFANALGRNRKEGRLSESDVQRSLELISLLHIEIAEGWDQFHLREALELMQHYFLTAYDAGYLALALRRHIPIATFDKDLRKAASAAGLVLAI